MRSEKNEAAAMFMIDKKRGDWRDLNCHELPCDSHRKE